MQFTLENEELCVKISSFGGEIQSIVEKRNGREYLWQGDSKFWDEKAPNLFPYIARLTEGKYTYHGKEYSMQIHGIVKCREMEAEEKGDELIFSLQSDEETLSQYPFRFRFEIRYRLRGNALTVTCRVENQEDRTMYFGIGGHPGFQVPYLRGTEFSDYVLQFPEAEQPFRVQFSEDCFVEGETPFTDLREGKLSLRHSLFDQDAIVLRGAGHSVRLCLGREWEQRAGKEEKREASAICVKFPQMNYVGFWHLPKSEAPYLCIEPWSSLPSRKGIVEDLERQENLLSLEGGEVYENTWEILIRKLISGRILPEHSRTDSCPLFEYAAEGGSILKSAGKCNFRNAQGSIF